MPRLLLTLLLLLGAPARAEQDDGFNGSVDVVPAVNQPSANPNDVPSEAQVPYEEPERVPVPMPIPKKDPRIDAESSRVPRWLHDICTAPALDEEFAERVSYTRTRKGELIKDYAKGNKLYGSLKLMLENYAELTRLVKVCEQNKTECLIHGRVPRPWETKSSPWQTVGARSFWTALLTNRAPAGISPTTDVLKVAKENLEQIQTAIHGKFYKLNDTDSLKGDAKSVSEALRLAKLLQNKTSCGVSAMSKTSTKLRSPASQK